jgi:ornithine cyclodeaminase/alanine dehydrogenase-like protein (mu-crystallin family)
VNLDVEIKKRGKGNMLFLNADEIMDALAFDAVVDSVEEALRVYEERAFVMPERMAVHCGDNNLLLLMPCVSMGSIATKVLTVFPGNRAMNRPVIDGIVILSDRSSGEILALMDGKTITSMRTGAVTGASIRHLARTDARSVGLVGCGAQGYYQLMYACTARDVRKITLFDIIPAVISPLIERLQKSLPGIGIEIARSTEELVRASDVVITATTARTPVFPDDPELFKGKHFVAIGSFEPDVREYPDAIFAVVEKVWIDIDFAKEESGELLVPLRDGNLREEQVETLGHFIQSGRAPERGAHGTTFFKSVGMALFDLTAARLAYANAVKKGLGTRL